METKIYTCNEELANILYSQGFRDATHKDDVNKRPNKLRFVLIGAPKRGEIHFFLGSLCILDYFERTGYGSQLTETDLKSLITYFRLERPDLMQVLGGCHILDIRMSSLNEIAIGVERFREEFAKIQSLNLQHKNRSRCKMFERVLRIYDTIRL